MVCLKQILQSIVLCRNVIQTIYASKFHNKQYVYAKYMPVWKWFNT